VAVVLLAAVGSFASLGRVYLDALYQAFDNTGAQFDFRGPYFGALDLVSGENPYRAGDNRENHSDRRARVLGIDRMSTLYSPPALLLYMPLTWLGGKWQGFAAARGVWLTLGVLAVLASVWLLSHLLDHRPRAVEIAAVYFLVAGFGPTSQNLIIGQSNLVLLLFLAVGTVAVGYGRPAIGGASLALAGLLKPLFAILIVPLVLRRSFRAAASFAAVMVGAGLASVAALGWDLNQDFLGTAAFAAAAPGGDLSNHSWHGLVLRSLAAGPDWQPWVNWPRAAAIVARAGSVAFVAVSAVVSWRGRRREDPSAAAADLSLWTATALVASPRTLDHYLVCALVPVVTVLWMLAKRRAWRTALLAAVAYQAMGIASRRLVVGPFPGVPALAFTNLQACGLLALYGLTVYAVAAPPSLAPSRRAWEAP